MGKLEVSAAGNTLVPAILALKAKGYRVSWTRRSNEDESWRAEGPLGGFGGESPEEVLGLIAMCEMRGEDWKAPDEEIDAFAKRYDADHGFA
jgi:hypothetical protein